MSAPRRLEAQVVGPGGGHTSEVPKPRAHAASQGERYDGEVGNGVADFVEQVFKGIQEFVEDLYKILVSSQ